MVQRRQANRVENRQKIAEAVARLAAERGIDAVSLRAVATEADTSMGNIQYQFGTVADLILFALQHVIEDIETVLQTADGETGQARLRESMLALLSEDPATITTICAFAQLRTSASRDPRARDLLAELHDRRVSAIETILKAARDNRLLHSMVDPHQEADVCWTLMLSIAIEVAQGIRARSQGLETLRYHFLRLARNKRVTRRPKA